MLANSASAATILIDPTTRNGSFETETTKQLTWGGVDSWDEWTGVSTANGDSGTDENPATATDGVRIAFLQGGNAAYNMTSHLVSVGDVYTYSWDHASRADRTHTVGLVFDDGGTVTSIVSSEITTTGLATPNTYGGGTYTVLAGDAAIGKTIGMGIHATAAYPEVDNFILSVDQVPEPSSAALLGLGGLALILRRRK